MENREPNTAHIGEMIKQKVERSGKSVTEFAKELNVERRTLYNIFEKPDIHTSMLRKISELLNYDFFQALSQETPPQMMVSESGAEYTTQRSGSDQSKICLMIELSDDSVHPEDTIAQITERLINKVSRPK